MPSKTTCVSCRLRRKKFDKTLPSCSRCEHLAIPCVYKDGVTLHAKDTQKTLDKERSRKKELETEIKNLRVLLASQQGKLATKTTEDYFYLPTTMTPDIHRKVIPLTAMNILSKERLKYISDKMMPGLFNVTPCLQVYEERCMAAVIGVEVNDGEFVILQMLEELMALLIPDQKNFREFLTVTKSQYYTRYVAGMPPIPGELLAEIEGCIAFDEADGTPCLTFDLFTEGHKLTHLALLILSLAVCYLINSRRVDRELQDAWNYALCLKYASSLLKIDCLNTRITLGDTNETSTTITIALFDLHLFRRYVACTILLCGYDSPQHSALTTRNLIQRARFQHLHEDLQKHYPGITPQCEQTFKNIWYSLAMLDLMDSLELGYVPSITLPEVSPLPPQMDNPVGRALVALHLAIYIINNMDENIPVDHILAKVEVCSRKIHDAFKNLGPTMEQDFHTLRHLGSSSRAALVGFYGAAEGYFIRSMMFATLLNIYCLATKALDSVGETMGTSDRAFMMKVLAVKYGLLCLYHYREFFYITATIGHERWNTTGHVGALSVVHFNTVLEPVGTRRALIWFGAYAREYMDLETADFVNFVVYHKDDPLVDAAMMKDLDNLLEPIPTLQELCDFSLDYDLTRLIKILGKIADPRMLTKSIAHVFMDLRNYLVITPEISLSCMRMTDTFCLGTKYASLGLRYFFPKSVVDKPRDRIITTDITESQKMAPDAALKLALNRWHVKRKGSESSENIDFGGTFRDFFEQELVTSKDEFSFDKYFDGLMMGNWVSDPSLFQPAHSDTFPEFNIGDFSLE